MDKHLMILLAYLLKLFLIFLLIKLHLLLMQVDEKHIEYITYLMNRSSLLVVLLNLECLFKKNINLKFLDDFMSIILHDFVGDNFSYHQIFLLVVKIWWVKEVTIFIVLLSLTLVKKIMEFFLNERILKSFLRYQL